MGNVLIQNKKERTLMIKRIPYDIEPLFSLAKTDILCNTSYPLKPQYFNDYRSKKDIMQAVESLSFYFHIPFCRHLCKFCEYIRFLNGEEKREMKYVSDLIDQADRYMDTHTVKLLYGLDIGGGTPTALKTSAFRMLVSYISNLLDTLPLDVNFESSTEFSFSTIDEEKIDIISRSGINRMSTGIQIYDKEILEKNHREMFSIMQMKKVMSRLHSAGIGKINLDIMYGFNEQTDLTIENTQRVIEELSPEQVTLYEMRYNRNTLPHEQITRQTLFDQYEKLYNGIRALGYHAEFGMNTFSKYSDSGVSSYLRRRMLEARAYKGFGISAQSMSMDGISYNILKSCKDTYLPDYDRLMEEDVYLLPKEEIAAKYVSVSLYHGQFSFAILSEILGTDAKEYYQQEAEYLEANKLIVDCENDICRLTRKGFLYYGAVAALFWSAHHRECYMKDRKSGGKTV